MGRIPLLIADIVHQLLDHGVLGIQDILIGERTHIHVFGGLLIGIQDMDIFHVGVIAQLDIIHA
jgi:hypothetical protein